MEGGQNLGTYRAAMPECGRQDESKEWLSVEQETSADDDTKENCCCYKLERNCAK